MDKNERDQRLRKQVPVKHLLDKVSFAHGISLKELRKTKAGKKNEAKSMAVYLSRRLTGLSQKDLGGWFKNSPYAVAKLQQRGLSFVPSAGFNIFYCRLVKSGPKFL